MIQKERGTIDTEGFKKLATILTIGGIYDLAILEYRRTGDFHKT